MKNIFNATDSNEIIERIEKLTSETKQVWGKMNVSQMMAHCNVTYEMVYENIHPKPNAFVRFLLKSFVKNKVVNDEVYKQNSQTAPVFLIKSDKNFEKEKARLIEHIKKTQELGPGYFEKKESHSFGVLKATEWNNMFYKHLDHHLRQFGV
ncbi:MAG: DUF1569 domain-containing protein [Crocinitomicaceae bacterium]|nr:DUF1569 domain-containing protein [Crocinitomicaceae bacterium]